MTSLTLPLATTTYEPGSMADSSTDSMSKFPHTRAQLSAIARQYKPLEMYDVNSSDEAGDEFNRVSSSLVNRVVALLVDEQEEDLKTLLKRTYGLDEAAVSEPCGVLDGD